MPAYMQTSDVVRAALTDAAAILAPDRSDIVQLLRLVLDEPQTYLDTYPASDYLCSDQGDLARSGLLDMLHGDEFGIGPALLAHFDWKDDVETIQPALEALESCPDGLTWDWYPDFASQTEENSSHTVEIAEDFRAETGDRCLALDVALIAIHVGDSYHLGFCPASHAERVVSLLCQAGYDGANIEQSTERDS
ncbi:hypothetical protein [Nocardia sp. NPDC060259]|uniref:DUF6630 family protein n=1 Tax=Nocardia sp. NPDC060259 TaxID=3347088 RepID=UPI00364C7A1A